MISLSLTSTLSARPLALATAVGLVLCAAPASAQLAPAAPAQPAQAKPAAAPVAQKPKPAPAPKAAQKPAAQPQEGAAEKAAASQPEVTAPAVPEGQKAWAKVCNTDEKTNKQACFTQQSLRNEAGQPLALIRVEEIVGENKRGLMVMVPLAVSPLLEPGVTLTIDKNKPVPGKYLTCNQAGCIAFLALSDALLGQMKKGEKAVLAAKNIQRKDLSIPFTLAQFKETYEAPGIDAKQLAAEQQKLQEGLQKRAEEARKKLLEQQATQPVSQPAK